jgi:hypothetical protein
MYEILNKVWMQIDYKSKYVNYKIMRLPYEIQKSIDNHVSKIEEKYPLWLETWKNLVED